MSARSSQLRPVPASIPAARDGVGASRLVVTDGPWSTVVDFLTTRLRPGIDWHARMVQGDVLNEQGRPLPADAGCVRGQVLWYWRSLAREPRVPFEMELLYCDANLVVVDKPHFLAAVPGGRYLQETAMVRLKRLLGNDDLVPLHRLDRETAGVLMFSARPTTRDVHHALLRERRVHKVYEAVAPWHADRLLPLTARHRLQDPQVPAICLCKWWAESRTRRPKSNFCGSWVAALPATRLRWNWPSTA